MRINIRMNGDLRLNSFGVLEVYREGCWQLA